MKRLAELDTDTHLIIDVVEFGAYPISMLKEQLRSWLAYDRNEPPKVYIAIANKLTIKASDVLNYLQDDYWQHAYFDWSLDVPPELKAEFQAVLDKIAAHDVLRNTAYTIGEQVDITELIKELTPTEEENEPT